jgi:hypothetical protein
MPSHFRPATGRTKKTLGLHGMHCLEVRLPHTSASRSPPLVSFGSSTGFISPVDVVVGGERRSSSAARDPGSVAMVSPQPPKQRSTGLLLHKKIL